MKTRKNIFEYGFTLIEVIVTLVVIAVVAAMIAVYFGTSYTQSSVPISRLMAAGNLNQIMEKITGDYNNAPTTWSPGTAYTTQHSSAHRRSSHGSQQKRISVYLLKPPEQAAPLNRIGHRLQRSALRLPMGRWSYMD